MMFVMTGPDMDFARGQATRAINVGLRLWKAGLNAHQASDLAEIEQQKLPTVKMAKA